MMVANITSFRYGVHVGSCVYCTSKPSEPVDKTNLCMMLTTSSIPNIVMSGADAPPTCCLNLLRGAANQRKVVLNGGAKSSNIWQIFVNILSKYFKNMTDLQIHIGLRRSTRFSFTHLLCNSLHCTFYIHIGEYTAAQLSLIPSYFSPGTYSRVTAYC